MFAFVILILKKKLIVDFVVFVAVVEVGQLTSTSLSDQIWLGDELGHVFVGFDDGGYLGDHLSVEVGDFVLQPYGM
jgi:glycerol uptake facilitator-like aquaporin